MFSPTTVMFIPFLAIGAILIIASLLLRKKSGSSNDEISDETITVAVNQQIEKSISDADNAMEQLNSMSSMILDELESKYKELLFLYQLIDDKKIEVESLMNETARLNEVIQNNQIAQQYIAAPPSVTDGYYGGAYYAKEQAGAAIGDYTNTMYNSKIDSTVTKIKDAKVAGRSLFDSDLPEKPNDTAKATDIIYSGDKLPPRYADKYKDIIQLTNEGMLPTEIAQRLNMGQGEVKLILTLARVRQD